MRNSIYPSTVPPVLKFLLIIIGAGNLLTGLFFHILAPLLSLSLPGLLHGFVWQVATYPLVLRSSLGFASFLNLAFDLIIIWIFGSAILERRGTKSFLKLIIGAILAGAFCGMLAMIGNPFFLFGPTPLVFAILMAWMVMNPEARVWLFVPIRAFWVIGALIVFDLLTRLSQGAWIGLCANIGGILYGFLYFKSPTWCTKKTKIYHHTKVFDIHSGQPILDDDRFMDAMLTRISRSGEDSLTPEEKKRMREISEKKTKK